MVSQFSVINRNSKIVNTFRWLVLSSSSHWMLQYLTQREHFSSTLKDVLLTFQAVWADSISWALPGRWRWTPPCWPDRLRPCPWSWRWSWPSRRGLNALGWRWSGSSSGRLTWPTSSSPTAQCSRCGQHHTYWNTKNVRVQTSGRYQVLMIFLWLLQRQPVSISVFRTEWSLFQIIRKRWIFFITEQEGYAVWHFVGNICHRFEKNYLNILILLIVSLLFRSYWLVVELGEWYES